jgi:Raf kinase inhibitor-like YbhB/YbcL family protein
MLEKIPVVLGYAVRRAGAGADALTYANEAFRSVALALQVTSHAFDDGAPIPPRYTADGEGISPPLAWTGVPPDTRQVVLVVEDRDSPTPSPLVHAIAWDLPAGPGHLPEGALKRPTSKGAWIDLGRASSLRPEYVAPAPPRGHGAHHYAFEVFALDRRVVFRRPPGRRELIAAMRGHVVAKGLLIGTYERPARPRVAR